MVSPTHAICDQCGFAHPPLAAGVICPMATQKTEKGIKVDLNDLFTPLKTIFLSQIDTKGITKPAEFIKYMIVEITQAAERYKEQ